MKNPIWKTSLSNLLQSSTNPQVKVLEDRLQNLEKRIRRVEERIAKIPDPFVVFYRPPGRDYVKLNEALDELYDKLNIIEQQERNG